MGLAQMAAAARNRGRGGGGSSGASRSGGKSKISAALIKQYALDPNLSYQQKMALAKEHGVNLGQIAGATGLSLKDLSKQARKETGINSIGDLMGKVGSGDISHDQALDLGYGIGGSPQERMQAMRASREYLQNQRPWQSRTPAANSLIGGRQSAGVLDQLFTGNADPELARGNMLNPLRSFRSTGPNSLEERIGPTSYAPVTGRPFGSAGADPNTGLHYQTTQPPWATGNLPSYGDPLSNAPNPSYNDASWGQGGGGASGQPQGPGGPPGGPRGNPEVPNQIPELPWPMFGMGGGMSPAFMGGMGGYGGPQLPPWMNRGTMGPGGGFDPYSMGSGTMPGMGGRPGAPDILGGMMSQSAPRGMYGQYSGGGMGGPNVMVPPWMNRGTMGPGGGFDPMSMGSSSMPSMSGRSGLPNVIGSQINPSAPHGMYGQHSGAPRMGSPPLQAPQSQVSTGIDTNAGAPMGNKPMGTGSVLDARMNQNAPRGMYGGGAMPPFMTGAGSMPSMSGRSGLPNVVGPQVNPSAPHGMYGQYSGGPMGGVGPPTGKMTGAGSVMAPPWMNRGTMGPGGAGGMQVPNNRGTIPSFGEGPLLAPSQAGTPIPGFPGVSTRPGLPSPSDILPGTPVGPGQTGGAPMTDAKRLQLIHGMLPLTDYAEQWLAPLQDEVTRDITRAYRQNVFPSIGRGSVASGGYGSSRQGIAEGLAAQDMGDTISREIAQLRNQTYENSLNRSLQATGQLNQNELQRQQMAIQAQLGAMGMLPSIQNAQFSGIDQIGRIGDAYQQQYQQRMAADKAQWDYWQNLPRQQLNDYMSLIQGNVGQLGGQTSTQQQGGGGFNTSGALGGAAVLGGLASTGYGIPLAILGGLLGGFG